MQRPLKITFGEMRESGVRGVLIYFTGYRCSHYVTALIDSRMIFEPAISTRFLCTACGSREADIRPDFRWDRPAALARGY